MATDPQELDRLSRDPGEARSALDDRSRVATVTGWLASRGAAGIPHPGGTLLAHLERVQSLLAEWGARPGLRRDFAELTAANELDIVRVNPDLRAQLGPDMLRLFTSWKDLLSDAAWQSVQTTLQ